MEMTLHITINNIPEEYFSDEQYDATKKYVKEKIDTIVDGLDGHLYDLEIK